MKKKSQRECCQRVARVHVRAMADQILAHNRAITVLALRLTVLQDAVRDAVKLIDAARARQWTPADDVLLTEIRALVAKE